MIVPSGSKHEVVGYYAISVERVQDNEEVSLSADEKDFLLRYAKKTLHYHLIKGEKPQVDSDSLTPALKRSYGAFVTFVS
ncbi:MAG: hypothetical protein U5L09_14875 [Bacteroidales bacterium]|nr:hypothetical protein [Bacteroidales bacterium]